MSIDSEVTSMTQNIQADYEGLTNLGVDLTGINKNIENIKPCLDTIYSNLPKVSDTGTEVTLSPTLKGKLGIVEKGNSEQDSTNGYQLLNIPDGTKTNNGITAVASNGEITLNNTATATSIIYYTFNYTFLAGQDYVVSANNSGTSSNVLVRFDTNVKPITLTNANTTQVISFETNTTVSSFCVRVANGTSLTNFKIKPMIEKGSTSHTWEPYTAGASPNPSYPQTIRNVTGNNNVVVRTAQLLNTTDYLLKNNVASAEKSGDNVIATISSGKTYGWVMYDLGNIENYRGKTLTLSLEENPSSMFTNSKFINCDSAGGNRTNLGNSLGSNTFVSYEISGTYTQTNLAILLYVNDVTGGETITFKKPMVNVGSSAKPYQPYGNQTKPLNLGSIELNKIGNYQDYIYKNNDKWYKHEEIGKKTLLETMIFQTTSYNNLYMITNYYSSIVYVLGGLCNYFTFINDDRITGNFQADAYMSNNQMAFRLGDTKDRLYIKSTSFENLTAFQNWLETHTTNVYYALAGATDIEITDTQLVEQLENIDKVKGYNGTTIITSTYDSNNAQMYLQVSSLKGE